MIPALNGLLAALVLIAVICRLTMIPVAPQGKRLPWNAWVAAHAMIGAGCFGYIAGATGGQLPSLAPTLTFFGLAVMMLFRWKRRGEDL
jgi:hypothetical protein